MPVSATPCPNPHASATPPGSEKRHPTGIELAPQVRWTSGEGSDPPQDQNSNNNTTTITTRGCYFVSRGLELGGWGAGGLGGSNI